MKKLLILSFYLFFPLLVVAQEGIRFREMSFDFGNVEEGSVAKHEFVFTNVGKDAVKIVSANPSCGCTVSEFTTTPVKPGEQGKVTASYSSAGRPGSFVKNIQVVTNSSQSPITLVIKGIVNPRSQVPAVSKEKLNLSPRLQLDKQRYDIGQIEKGSATTALFTIKNPGRSSLKISSLNSICQCVSYKISKPIIAPRDSATLELTYRPYTVSKYGEWVSIFSNDLVYPKISVHLQADVVESLNKQSEVKEEKPKTPFR